MFFIKYYYHNDTRECFLSSCRDYYYQFNYECNQTGCPENTSQTEYKCKNEYNGSFCNNYFYKDNNEEIICLPDDNCPNEYPYINIYTKECFDSLEKCDFFLKIFVIVIVQMVK